MKKHFLLSALIILTPFILISCVSSLLKEKEPTFSKDVEFESPKSPYYKLDKSVFPSWKSKISGNVISIFSDCQNEGIRTLNDLQKYIEDSIENSKRIKETIVQFQNKPALSLVIQGELESNPIEIQSISFNRPNCGYVVSLSGKPQQLKVDQIAFEQFTASLRFK
ncbi:MAG: hypothetical protein WA160_11860 [Pseudobdellovibrio sp.]